MPKYNECERKSEQFAQKVKIYNVNVNQSGVWLFLATLGCWSINDHGMRGAAILCTFMIFSHQLFTGIAADYLSCLFLGTGIAYWVGYFS